MNVPGLVQEGASIRIELEGIAAPFSGSGDETRVAFLLVDPLAEAA